MYHFDETKPVRTVQGMKVRIICNDRKYYRPIVALVENDGREEDMVIEYNSDGCHPFNPTLDLVNE